jgi:hypothetical protein
MDDQEIITSAQVVYLKAKKFKISILSYRSQTVDTSVMRIKYHTLVSFVLNNIVSPNDNYGNYFRIKWVFDTLEI